ncbi:MAG: hypothetical protein AUK28_04520 [Desulfobacterales bacterium CG2_30_60_27]|nr:MAG: hypothetical protein AUK28_04520 [Desulfobacterales bacterium CG2_30_60_27]
MTRRFLLAAALIVALAAGPARALEPADLLIVCNSRMPGSRAVAEHYARQRQVPTANIIELALTDSESMPRTDFETSLLLPLRQQVLALQEKGRQPALLLVYGVPLKVGVAPEAVSAEEKAQLPHRLADLEALAASLAGRLAGHTGQEPPSSAAAPLPYARSVVQQTLRFLAAPPKPPPTPATLAEIHSLLYLLAGTEPFARLASGKADGGEDFLVKLHGIVANQLASLPFLGVPPGLELQTAALIRAGQGLVGELSFWQERQQRDPEPMTAAAVDSELALLLAGSYDLARWLPNPWHVQFDQWPGIAAIRGRTIMVARLDGPSPAHAKRLVDDALWAEAHGLAGNFCIDARGLSPAKDGFYGEYDQQLRTLRDILQKQSDLPVIFDDTPDLFGPGACPKTALYCGWYSLTKYVDAFAWQRGSVGFHVASGEASTLRAANSQVWVKRMIEEGVAATLGPVQEPYLQSFPRPDLFFPLLLAGRLPLIEVYFRSTPFLSWRQVLIGDPLYNPFKTRPAIKAESPLP